MHLGTIAEAIYHSNSINTLVHYPTQQLSQDELMERRAYIIKQLQLEDSRILKQKLAGTSVFSTLTIAGAFHTIPVHEEYQNYTSFNTPRRQYRFCRLPFGLANVPSAYSRLVQMALDRLPPGFAMGYIDDIITNSQTEDEHIEHLCQIVRLHVDVGMKLNLQKHNRWKSSILGM